MVKAKFNQINSVRDPHNDLLSVSVISDLERGRLTVNVIGESGDRLGGTSFQTGIDGTRKIDFMPLQEISPQQFTLQLTQKGETEILDEKIFEWKGFEKSKPITFPQDLLNAQPKISIADLISKLDNSLRKVVLKKPEKEFDIHDAFEQLLAGTNYEGAFTRDAESIPTSGRSYKKPDFVIDELSLAVEIKFCNSKQKSKDIVEEMNADIRPYNKKYQNIIFLVYDLGFILDKDEFVSDFHIIPKVQVVIVKH